MVFRVTLTYDDSDLRRGLNTFDRRFSQWVQGVVERGGDQGTAYMKINAPWHDRTGNARSGLHAVAYQDGKVHTLILAHGVSYGIWLEVRFAGQYSIIPQSIEWTGHAIMNTLNGGMRSI